MTIFGNTRSIDVHKFTVSLTDRRTGELSEVVVYRPECRDGRSSIIEAYNNLGYNVDAIETETVICPINWAHVFGFYKQCKGTEDERLEQTAEAEAVSA